MPMRPRAVQPRMPISPWYKRAGDHIKNKWYSMRRKHQRARDSFVNEEEDFRQLSGWRKAKLIVQTR